VLFDKAALPTSRFGDRKSASLTSTDQTRTPHVNGGQIEGLQDKNQWFARFVIAIEKNQHQVHRVTTPLDDSNTVPIVDRTPGR